MSWTNVIRAGIAVVAITSLGVAFWEHSKRKVTNTAAVKEEADIVRALIEELETKLAGSAYVLERADAAKLSDIGADVACLDVSLTTLRAHAEWLKAQLNKVF